MDGLIVYIAGVEWDAVPGTDRNLVASLAEKARILWVDPPISPVRYLRALRGGHRWDIGLKTVTPSIIRLRVLALPGTSRPLIRDLISMRVSRSIYRARSQCAPSSEVCAIVNASPEAVFPPGLNGRRLFYITDDWVDGARLIGMKPRRVRRRMLRNATDAHVIAAVTPGLADTIDKDPGEIALLPNGCTIPDPGPPSARRLRPKDLPAGPVVALVGQINERIDFSAVRAVADAGVTVAVIGPRTEREATTAITIDELFEHRKIHWLGRKAASELPEYLAGTDVGITPYLDTPFNRRSFPLKTLEYLAAGLPVISTDLPATRLLDCPQVTIAANPCEFAQLVVAKIAEERLVSAAECVAFAQLHTWEIRATRLLELIEEDHSVRQPEGETDVHSDSTDRQLLP